MRKIVTIHSPAVLVPTANIDTDQIIPARFLKTTSREGFGKKLFYDWRPADPPGDAYLWPETISAAAPAASMPPGR